MVTTRLSSGSVSLRSLLVDARDGAVDATDSNGCVGSPFRANAVPHSIQNLAIGWLTVPQFGQMARRLPHSRQNFASGGLTVRQFGQRICKESYLGFAIILWLSASFVLYNAGREKDYMLDERSKFAYYEDC